MKNIKVFSCCLVVFFICYSSFSFASVSKSDLLKINISTGLVFLFDTDNKPDDSPDSYSLSFDKTLKNWTLKDSLNNDLGNLKIVGVLIKNSKIITMTDIGKEKILGISDLQDIKVLSSKQGSKWFDNIVKSNMSTSIASMQQDLDKDKLDINDIKISILYTRDFEQTYDALLFSSQIRVPVDYSYLDFYKYRSKKYADTIKFLQPLVMNEKNKLIAVQKRIMSLLPADKAHKFYCMLDYDNQGNAYKNMHDSCFVKIISDKSTIDILDALNDIYDKQYKKLLFIQNTLKENKYYLYNNQLLISGLLKKHKQSELEDNLSRELNIN